MDPIVAMEPTLHHMAYQLAATPVSQWMVRREWTIVLSQSIHIVMVAVVFGCATLIDLPLLGVKIGRRPVSTLVHDLVPWMYGALLGLVATGTYQTVAEPKREFVTPAFWFKMAMILIVVLLTMAFARAVKRNPERWDHASSRPVTAIPFAVISLALWIAIIFCGRLIGYVYQFYL